MKRITPRKTKEVFEIKYFLKSYEYPGRSKLSKKKQTKKQQQNQAGLKCLYSERNGGKKNKQRG